MGVGRKGRRGGRGLIERISRDARVPVIKHLDGICHVYIDDKADLEKAFDVALNAKTQRYGTCNTMETLLVADAVAVDILPRLGGAQVGAVAEAQLRHAVVDGLAIHHRRRDGGHQGRAVDHLLLRSAAEQRRGKRGDPEHPSWSHEINPNRR